MANTVRARVLRKNSYEYPYDCAHTEAINCANSTIEATGWYIPEIKQGRWVGWNFQITTTKPRPDAVKVAKIRNRQDGLVYYIALQDADAAQLFNDKCNACCDAVTDMPLMATLPDPMIEVVACYDSTTSKYVVKTYAVPLSGGKVYKPKGSQNDVYFTPATPGGGFATVALFITWANTNWSAYGAWTNSGQTVILSSNTANETWIDMNPSL